MFFSYFFHFMSICASNIDNCCVIWPFYMISSHYWKCFILHLLFVSFFYENVSPGSRFLPQGLGCFPVWLNARIGNWASCHQFMQVKNHLPWFPPYLRWSYILTHIWNECCANLGWNVFWLSCEPETIRFRIKQMEVIYYLWEEYANLFLEIIILHNWWG